MITIQTILLQGLAKHGNNFKITKSDLINQSNMSETEVCIALNTITMFNDAWRMVKD